MDLQLIFDTIEPLTIGQLYLEPTEVVVSNPVALTEAIILAIVARLRLGRTHMSIRDESKTILPNNKSLSLEQIAAVDDARLARIALLQG